MGFIEDNYGDFFVVYDIVSDAALDGIKQLGFSESGLSAQKHSQLPVEVNNIDRVKGRVDCFEEVRIEALGEGPYMQCLACARVAGDKHYAPLFASCVQGIWIVPPWRDRQTCLWF